MKQNLIDKSCFLYETKYNDLFSEIPRNYLNLIFRTILSIHLIIKNPVATFLVRAIVIGLTLKVQLRNTFFLKFA